MAFILFWTSLYCLSTYVFETTIFISTIYQKMTVIIANWRHISIWERRALKSNWQLREIVETLGKARSILWFYPWLPWYCSASIQFWFALFWGKSMYLNSLVIPLFQYLFSSVIKRMDFEVVFPITCAATATLGIIILKKYLINLNQIIKNILITLCVQNLGSSVLSIIFLTIWENEIDRRTKCDALQVFTMSNIHVTIIHQILLGMENFQIGGYKYLLYSQSDCIWIRLRLPTSNLQNNICLNAFRIVLHW